MTMDLPNMGRKPFQEATVRHVVERLSDLRGSRRFLVADEVGLGKTLIAQGILQYLALKPQIRPFNVFYVCSSLTIARQNRASLLEVLPPAEREAAVVTVDRPTLLPEVSPSQSNRFTLFSLTPGTLPIKGASSGRVDERAAIWCLLKEGLSLTKPQRKALEDKLKRVQVQATWDNQVNKRSSNPMLKGIRALATPFVNEVRTMLRLPGAADSTVAEALRERFAQEELGTIQSLRKILGRLGLQNLRPNLVILDEFQRFFEVIAPFRGQSEATADRNVPNEPDELSDDDEDAHGLLRLILDARDGGPGPATLLLSATPYRPPASMVDVDGLKHYEQFFQLLEFLYGAEAQTQVPHLRKAFRRYGALLRDALPGNRDVPMIRDDIQERLFRVIARTEREALLGDTARSVPPERRHVDLHPNDVRVFRHLWNSADKRDQSDVATYWTSIPYPLQMMDQRYLLRKRAQCIDPFPPGGQPLALRARQVRRYEDSLPPHPRMRALLDAVPTTLLELPWLPPSLPWWRLGGCFAQAAIPEGLSKILIFSRFRAVPRSIASLLSYESERQVYAGARGRTRRYDYFGRGGGSKDEVVEQDLGLDPLPAPSFTWNASTVDHPLLFLFIPAPYLGDIGDPQRLPHFTDGKLQYENARRFMANKLVEIFANHSLKVRVVSGARTSHAWRALIRLERSSNTWQFLRGALNSWLKTTTNQHAKKAVNAWLLENHEQIEISTVDVEELAELALVGPGVVLHRAAKRVFGRAGDGKIRVERSVTIAFGALRTYLDEPEFHLTLAEPGRNTPNHRADIRTAIWQGNLEAVLDEYFSIHAGLGAACIDAGREEKALDALEHALSIRVSSVQAHAIGDTCPSFRLRCHSAMPFGLSPDKDERSDEQTEARPDTLRLAFNSPFRPFVLATTSIGQEGLDFHVYCDRLVHWDLPGSPVDLEQREGRINRYGGLSIRKVLAKPYTDGTAPLPDNGSVWLSVTQGIPETCEGMSPWWGTEGAKVHRIVFLPPLAQQEAELERLLASLSHYRLALGQSDPEQLLRALRRKLDGAKTDEEKQAIHQWLREMRINLAPVQREIK